ncbi:MAG: CPBP family intramembrane metalloprotease [Acidobacteriota bacterium]|nr:CPBP family intramembrane metalloprotease [Acidobacteriota bacterium]
MIGSESSSPKPQPVPSQDGASPAPTGALQYSSGEQPGIPVIRPILPEGEAILQPPLDNTPNDAPPEPPARIPHLGHALLFLAATGTILMFSQVVVLLVLQRAGVHPRTPQAIPPGLLLFAEAFTYVASLGVAWIVFPLLWDRPFAVGLQLNPAAAWRNLLRLIPIGLILSYTVQAISSVVTMPRTIPMDDFFRTRTDVWLITAFGTLLAPLFEEVVFRGFLFPAFAIAYDWIALPRTPAAIATWQSNNRLTPAALVFSAVLSSICFAALHGRQVAFTWPVLLMLFVVSLFLTLIRYRLRSVAASAVVHASYNFAVFLSAFIATGGYRHLERMTH